METIFLKKAMIVSLTSSFSIIVVKCLKKPLIVAPENCGREDKFSSACSVLFDQTSLIFGYF